MHQHATLADTVYFWFAANDTAGSGADGETPIYDVRLAGAAANAAPVLSGSATLLTHANYPSGAHEVAITATTDNGFAAGNTYAVFCTLLVDSQNPTGFVGSFSLAPIPSDVKKWDGHAVLAHTVEGAPVVTVKVGTGAATGELNIASGVAAASGNWNTTTPPTVAAIATAIWQDLVAGTDFTTAASVGVLLNALAKACGATGTVAATKAAGAALGLPLSDANSKVAAKVARGDVGYDP